MDKKLLRFAAAVLAAILLFSFSACKIKDGDYGRLRFFGYQPFAVYEKATIPLRLFTETPETLMPFA